MHKTSHRRLTSKRVAPPHFPWAFIVLLTLLALPSAASAAASEELVIFTRGADSSVSQDFASEHLPSLLAEAEKLGLETRVVDVDVAGAPEEVRLTPLIVYQSPRGRGFFQGRYVDAGKVAHFVRTQRAVPPTTGSFEAKDSAVATLGRALTLAPIKITALAGQLPEDHDASTFAQKARDAILAGFESFERRDATLGPSDRSFYMDFHPYRSKDGRIYISVALFSQFNCIEPVFTAFDDPVSGDWSSWTDAFARAAKRLEVEVFRQIEQSNIGDGFDGIPENLAAPTWPDLGLELPARAPGAAVVDVDIKLPTRWRLGAPPEASGPRLIFRFPAPLDRYSGEVTELEAALELSTPEQLGGARGFVTAHTSSVTMGEKTLDNAVRGKMIFADRFPKARFQLENAEADAPLAFGRISRMVASGTFTMMGIEIPLGVRAQLEPIIGEDGEPRLHVQAGFDLRLESPFGIAGPDGPAPANDTLNFHLDVLLEADLSLDADAGDSSASAPSAN